MAHDEPDDEEICQMALRAAFDKGMEMCGSREAQMNQTARLFGIEPAGEPDIDCETALSEGLNAETLDSFRGLRQWVMCRAFEVAEDEDQPFDLAVQQAWEEAEEAAGSNTAVSSIGMTKSGP